MENTLTKQEMIELRKIYEEMAFDEVLSSILNMTINSEKEEGYSKKLA